jgi:P4 family phage/plasmid primase-like protien
MVHPLPGQPLITHSLGTALVKHRDILAHLAPEEHYNIYYTLAHHSGIEGASLPQRTAATFAYQTVVAWDIDGGEVGKAMEYATCVAELLEVAVTDLTIVASGNGVHVLANLKYPIRSVKFFAEHKSAYKEACNRIAEKMAARGLPGKVDPSIFEPARVLRLPGTLNKKQGKTDTRCELVQYVDTQLEFDLHRVSGLEEIQEQNIGPQELRRKFPTPDFETMVRECQFTSWLVGKPDDDEVKEYHVFDLLSLLGNMPPTAKATIDGVGVDARTLGERVFEGAINSTSLQRAEFEDKWQGASRYGSRTCTTINEHWGKCQSCPHFGKIPTPLALKGPDHISSEGTGYWVLDQKGNYRHPNYSDLAKIFQREFSYVSLSSGEQLRRYTGTHYEHLEILPIKAWLERKVNPADPLRESHRVEFVAKIKVCGAIGAKAEDELFEQSILARLNCRNGVLNIKTGEFQIHSPNIGFQNVLPYDYQEALASEFFLDWLATITRNRVELIDSLLDIMAYCLWPAFDDHLFVYLVGEGSNGKSTFINVLRAVLGANNVSAVNIQQLTRNRFAPANLEGKMANLSEESSGTDLDSDQLNLLKNLSAGGEMMIERKGEQGYEYRNKAKLIFSANKIPRFHENSEAIKRRLVVIPFDYTIVDKDANVERRLIEEAPAILSMLVRRIQANTTANGGKFLVSRGTQMHEEAQKTFLTAGNTVVEWAKENLDYGLHLSDDKYVLPKEAYAQYRNWCGEAGIQHPVNLITFGKQMVSFVVPKTAANPIKKIGGVTVRVYRRVQFIGKEGVA